MEFRVQYKRLLKNIQITKKNKLKRYKPYRRLNLVKILERLQEIILQDFIIKLLKLKDPITRQIYNAILVIVDKLIKQGYFIAYTEEILAEDIARIYIKEVFIRYRVLIKIILDRDLRFVVVFQEVFLAEQGVRVATSTVYYLQIDG